MLVVIATPSLSLCVYDLNIFEISCGKKFPCILLYGMYIKHGENGRKVKMERICSWCFLFAIQTNGALKQNSTMYRVNSEVSRKDWMKFSNKQNSKLRSSKHTQLFAIFCQYSAGEHYVVLVGCDIVTNVNLDMVLLFCTTIKTTIHSPVFLITECVSVCVYLTTHNEWMKQCHSFNMRIIK